MNDKPADVGLIGLGVMGSNLALNMADHGFRVAAYNRTWEVTERFLSENPDTPGGLAGAKTLEDLADAVSRPRRIVMMVKAGAVTDKVIDATVPHLQEGDVLVDGGNSLWTDTIAREKRLAEKGIRFVGSGVSGGEVGARFGPSLMPGGTREAWEDLAPIWNAIAAKVDEASGKPLEGAVPGRPVEGGIPCTTWIGPNGAGHYVKMVHNGIEYGDMQMICESYAIMRSLLGMGPSDMGDVFARWNEGVLDSYLVEITADILRQVDPVTGRPFVDVVLDTAGQKGTGKWTSQSSLDLGVPAPTVAEAVFARFVSALKEERVAAAKVIPGVSRRFDGSVESCLEAVHDALYCSKICSYAQGFQLMRAAQEEYGWKLDLGAVARIWRGGCIIRAGFLQKITDAYERKAELANLLVDPFFIEEIKSRQENWRWVVAEAAGHGIPVPSFMSALAYFDSYRSERLPANLLQAQRDYFGAHTYERLDQPRGTFFHLDWSSKEREQSDR